MPPYPSLNGRVVVVTGGGRGFGRLMALALAAEGARVMITAARAKGELDETVAMAAEAGGGEVRGVMADVGAWADCRRVADETRSAFGRVDALVNNAGRSSSEARGPGGAGRPKMWEVDPEGLSRLVTTNVVGPLLMTKAVVDGMLAHGFGRIVNVSTSRTTMVGSGPYGPTKAALEAQTVGLARDLGGTGVTANVLLPGAASDTDFIGGGRVGERAWPGFKPGKGMGHEGDASGGLLPPGIMVAPLLWLVSDASAAVSGKRFVARNWDDELEPEAAARGAMQESHAFPTVM